MIAIRYTIIPNAKAKNQQNHILSSLPPNQKQKEKAVVFLRCENRSMRQAAWVLCVSVSTLGDWNKGFAKSLAVFLNGEGIPDPDPRGERVTDDSFYLLFNAHHEPIVFRLPDEKWAGSWLVIVNTEAGWCEEADRKHGPSEEIRVAGRSLVVLQRIE